MTRTLYIIAAVISICYLNTKSLTEPVNRNDINGQRHITLSSARSADSKCIPTSNIKARYLLFLILTSETVRLVSLAPSVNKRIHFSTCKYSTALLRSQSDNGEWATKSCIKAIDVPLCRDIPNYITTITRQHDTETYLLFNIRYKV